jgi:hypothetical protein
MEVLKFFRNCAVAVLAGKGAAALVIGGLEYTNITPTHDEKLLEGATPVVENITEIVTRNGVETSITYPDTVGWTIKASKFEYR